ncbi:hypothetical protein FACS189425_04660 [Clostridia bacterium]|nr:hypothetical protein FACS189425_04660 [Clostridia bacterium]
MKRLLAIAIALMLALSLTACMGNTVDSTSPSPSAGGNSPSSNPSGGGEGEPSTDPEPSLPEMTSDAITLHYATWDDYEMAELLAAKFTEKYPNITVIVDRPGGTGEYMNAVLTMAANHEMPDVYQFLELATPISNGWFYDFTEFWNNDPESDGYFDSLKPGSTIDGKRVMRVVGEYLPEVAFLDRAVFNKLNVPLPAYDWTYEDMIQLIKDMTRPDQNIFGYNYMGGAGPVTLAPIVLNDALAEFGWDGANYHMAGAWADAVNQMAEFQLNSNQALQGTQAWEAASGDANMWPGNSGLIAMQLDAWWTLNNIYSKSEAKEKGVDMVPYTMPRGASAQTERKPAFLDYAAISSATEHPREAYELLKWMSFSSEAWLVRIEGFKTLTDEAGNKLYDLPNCLPLTNDEAIWSEYAKLYPADEAYPEFFKHARSPVPLGSQGIPGFAGWLTDVYQNGDYNGYTGIEAAVFAGAMNANDAVADLEAKGRQYYDEMMTTFYAVYGN